MAENSSNNQENNKKYPGYPHYPAKDDALPRPNVDKEERKNDDDIVMGTDADVSRKDIELLDYAEKNMDTTDDTNLIRAELDNTDEDGDPLNEDADETFTGNELDVPGSELDDADENIGEEDEENNYYSLGGDDKENLEEDRS